MRGIRYSPTCHILIQRQGWRKSGRPESSHIGFGNWNNSACLSHHSIKRMDSISEMPIFCGMAPECWIWASRRLHNPISESFLAPPPLDAGDILPEEVMGGFLCIHIRRGDYVNVASHLISDGEFISLVRKFSGLINHAVILSDSPIEPDFRNAVSPHFSTVSFLDNIDPYSSHRVMRCARILICSNSTFSLTAAALNPNALVVVPKQWYGEKDREIEAPIHARCLFQMIQF